MDAKQLSELQEKLKEAEKIKGIINKIQQVKEIYTKRDLDVGNIQLTYDVSESSGWGSDEYEKDVSHLFNFNATQLGISQQEFTELYKTVIMLTLKEFEKRLIAYYDTI